MATTSSRLAVQSKDKLPALVDQLIAAAQPGELDELLARSAKPVAAAGARRAA